jgi:5-methylcytosine-specific restriction endonuclease McrA
VSLRSLSDSAILSRIQELVCKERAITIAVLLHLNEIERRRLHLKLGFSSLFDYCTSRLGYSASAAVRRIRTARCVARFPRIYELLQKNEVNLSTIAQVSGALTSKNHEELVLRIRGRSQREVEAILAEYQPCPMPRDRVRTIVVPIAAARNGGVTAAAAVETEHSPASFAVAAHTAAALPTPTDACEKSDYNRSGCVFETRAARPACPGGGGGAANYERRTLLRFSASEPFIAKLERVKSLAWHRLPTNPSLEQVFELALDIALERDDRAKRVERRERRAKSAASVQERSSASPRPQSRHIPARVRDTVFERDGERCTYVGVGGRRCNATRALQIDHITPVARGGASTPGNLRLLCAYHNRLEAERLMGPTRAGRLI